MTNKHDKVLSASHRLEVLAIAAKEIVSLMRAGNDNSAYAMTYWLRREIGYVVSSLGEGVPTAQQLAFVTQYVKPVIEDKIN